MSAAEVEGISSTARITAPADPRLTESATERWDFNKGPNGVFDSYVNQVTKESQPLNQEQGNALIAKFLAADEEIKARK